MMSFDVCFLKSNHTKSLAYFHYLCLLYCNKYYLQQIHFINTGKQYVQQCVLCQDILGLYIAS